MSRSSCFCERWRPQSSAWSRGQQTESDLTLLAQPGSSLGGAHPKAAIEDQRQRYIAKFQSRLETERVGAWEVTMLDLVEAAGLRGWPRIGCSMRTASGLSCWWNGLIDNTGEGPLRLSDDPGRSG